MKWELGQKTYDNRLSLRAAYVSLYYALDRALSKVYTPPVVN